MYLPVSIFAKSIRLFAHRYRLAARAAEFGISGFNIALRTRAWPYLQRLHDLTQQKIGLAVIQGDCHRFIDECPHRPQSVLVALPPLRYAEPARLRAGATAKAILASLPEALAEQILARSADVVDPSNEACVDIDAWRRAAPSRDELARIRQAGYASSRGERGRDSGTVSLSAPVVDRIGSVAASHGSAEPRRSKRRRWRPRWCRQRRTFDGVGRGFLGFALTGLPKRHLLKINAEIEFPGDSQSTPPK